MSNNAINVRAQFRDSTGKVRANGYVYFYENNTVTLASIFSDELLSVPQSNPYRLNANGEINGDVKYTGKLTVKATNSDGSDPLSDNDVESQGGSVSGVFTSQFETVPTDPATMAVSIKAGRTMNGETFVDVAAQTTTLIIAPVSNPRIDRIVIDRLTGVYSIVAGSESASPVAPAIPVGKAPSSQIALTTTITSITESIITDERISGSIEPSNANTTETLTNKTIGDTNIINAQDDAFTIDNSVDGTKQIDFSAGGSAGTKTTISTSQTVNRTLALPNATDTLVGKATTDIFTNKTIGDSNIITAQDDAFTIVNSADPTLLIDFDSAGTTGTKTTVKSSQTTNKIITLPDATDTLIGKATTDTLTNKTLSSPTVSNPLCTGTTTVAILKNATHTLDGGYYTARTDSTSTGLNALSSLNTTTVRYCSAFGYNALTANVSGFFNSAFGYAALSANTADQNSAFGYNSLLGNTTGAQNSAFGYGSLATNIGAAGNSAFGHNSLTANTSGDENSAFGGSALSSNTVGLQNTAIGHFALRANTSGNYNSAGGRNAMASNQTGINNTAFGESALSSSTAASYCAAFGSNALEASTGGGNSAFGYASLGQNTTGINNTAFGYAAGDLTTTGSNNTNIGFNADPTTASASNEVTLGNSSVTVLRCQQTTITALSDERDKANIQDLTLGTAFINKLRPVSFDWNMRDGAKVGEADTGFIAQDLKAAQSDGDILPGLVYESNPEKLEAGYGKLLPVMVKALQEMSERIKVLEAIISDNEIAVK